MLQIDLKLVSFQEVIGPDGHPGYHHLVALAHALVELRHHAFVTQRRSREIIALWEKLTDRDKVPVSFPPLPPGQAGQGEV